MFSLFKKTEKSTKPKSLGRLGEEAAQEEYKKLGYKIIATNEYNKKGKQLGEIDFIAKNDKKIIFVEVKTRNPAKAKFGTAEESVNIYKQKKILSAVKVYLLTHNEYVNLQPQIDVCVMKYDELDKTLKCDKIILNAVEDSF